MSRYEQMTKGELINELKVQRDSLERLKAVVDGSRDAVFISDENSRFVLANAAACELTGYSEEEILEMRIPDLHEDVDRHAYNAHHDSILDGQEALTEAEVLRKDGTKVATEFNNRRIMIAGIPHMHTVARDITDRRRAEEAVRTEAVMRATLVHNLPFIVLILKKGTREILYSNEQGRSVGAVPGTTCYESWAERGNPCPFCLAPELWATDRPQFLEVLYRGRNYEGRWLPLTETEYVHYIFDTTKHKQLEDELRESRNRLRNLTVRLDEVREEERTILARELHDEVGQALTAMRMDLAMFEKEIPALEQLAKRLPLMIDLTQDSVDRVNRMSFELRSPVLDLLGLEAAVESEALEYRERWGTEIGLQLELGELEALPERDTMVCRILKEALSNVRRHAQANRVEVSLRVAEEELVLEVLDDGIGITDEQLRDQRSFGLIGMRERVERLGGSVEIERRPEGGTRVRAKIPIVPKSR